MSINIESNYQEKSSLTPATPDSVVESGEGGGELGVWTQDRVTKLDKLARGASFDNKSQFEIPAGVIDTTNYNVSITDSERHLGLAITGSALAPDGGLLDGTVEAVSSDGASLGVRSVSGAFIASFAPFDPVTEGADGSGTQVPTIDATFVPLADGLSSEKENIQYPTGSISASYGYVAGAITDVFGEPVQSETVAATGAATATDSDGVYSLLTPGGTDVTLHSIGGSITQSVTPTAGTTTQLDWTFPGITVSIFGPEMNPVVDAPVEVGEKVYRTGSDGRAIMPKLLAQTYKLRIMGSMEEEVTLSTEGQLKKIQKKAASRLDIRAVEKGSGQSIVNLLAVEEDSGTFSYSSKDGVVSIISLDAASLGVVLGQSDERYHSKTVSADLTDGQVKEIKAELERQPAITSR